MHRARAGVVASLVVVAVALVAAGCLGSSGPVGPEVEPLGAVPDLSGRRDPGGLQAAPPRLAPPIHDDLAEVEETVGPSPATAHFAISWADPDPAMLVDLVVRFVPGDPEAVARLRDAGMRVTALSAGTGLAMGSARVESLEAVADVEGVLSVEVEPPAEPLREVATPADPAGAMG